MIITRNRTPSKYVYYGLHLYFSGLSSRKASERLFRMCKRNQVTIWNWIQKYHPKQISLKRKRISEFIVDETLLLKVGSEYIWLWVAIESETRQILALSISKERNMLIAERFLSDIVKMWKTSSFYRWRYLVSTGLQVSKLKSPYYSSMEKSLIESNMQYIKDRTENFDNYFPCRLKNCKLKHVRNWLRLFVDYHNKRDKSS